MISVLELFFRAIVLSLAVKISLSGRGIYRKDIDTATTAVSIYKDFLKAIRE